MQYIRLLFIISFSLIISACGFNPVYKEDNNPTRLLLENIDIEESNSIEGVEFYNHLHNILPHGSNSKYILATNISFIKGISIIEKNSDILRETVSIKISYTLKDKSTKLTINSGEFSRFASFNTGASPYSNTVIIQDTKSRLAIVAAEEIRNRIILFTRNKKQNN